MIQAAPSRALSTLAGYDPELLASMSPSAQRDLELAGGAWCWAALTLSAPVVYACWLLTHLGWLSLVAGTGALFVLVQVVRLTVAGAGLPASASIEVVRSYRPAWSPVLWFALLGAMFAQPAQLPLWQREHGALVAAERSELLAQHARALDALDGAVRAASLDSFERQLQHNEFLVLRLCSLWSSPSRAAQYTLLYLLVVLGPLVFAQLYARRTLCRYQWLRVRSSRRIVSAEARRSQQRVHAALARYSSYRGRSHDTSGERTAPLRLHWPMASVDRKEDA